MIGLPMGIRLLIVSYWTTNQTFLVQILIYKNRMIKRIIREDEERDQEEIQDCQRSILSILDAKHSEQPSDFTKIQSLIVTLPLWIFFLLLFAWKANIVCLLSIVSQTCFNKNYFHLLTTGFVYSLSC